MTIMVEAYRDAVPDDLIDGAEARQLLAPEEDLAGDLEPVNSLCEPEDLPARLADVVVPKDPAVRASMRMPVVIHRRPAPEVPELVAPLEEAIGHCALWNTATARRIIETHGALSIPLHLLEVVYDDDQTHDSATDDEEEDDAPLEAVWGGARYSIDARPDDIPSDPEQTDFGDENRQMLRLVVSGLSGDPDGRKVTDWTEIPSEDKRVTFKRRFAIYPLPRGWSVTVGETVTVPGSGSTNSPEVPDPVVSFEAWLTSAYVHPEEMFRKPGKPHAREMADTGEDGVKADTKAGLRREESLGYALPADVRAAMDRSGRTHNFMRRIRILAHRLAHPDDTHAA